MVKSPQIKFLSKITIFGVPSMSGFGPSGCTPYYEVYQVMGVENNFLFSNKKDTEQVRFYYKNEGIIELDVHEKIPLTGNLLV